MWSFVDEPAAPQEFLVQVLPRVQEMYLGQYNRAYAALEQGAFMREAGAWAMADGKPELLEPTTDAPEYLKVEGK